MINKKLLLLLILLFALIIRVYRLDYPKAFVFDEVYYPFTAMEYLKGNTDAWTYSGRPPMGHAYAWVNPPLPQEIMAVSMFVLRSTESFAWRIPGVLFGIFAIYLVYLIAKELFHEEDLALLSSFIFSLDGLNFVQSRTAMLDIYLVAFCLLCIYLLLKKHFLLSAIFFGCALASKWTGIYLLLPILFYLIKSKKLLFSPLFIALGLLTYLAIYIPFFATHHTWSEFSNLFQQQLGYHLHLKATHDYASPWWSWPFNLYPVWYFVEYQKDQMANIFASGTPAIFWLGSISILITIFDSIKKRSFELLFILLCFFAFWLPWSISPRIMFLYYFIPSVPFLCIALAYQINKLLKENEYHSLGVGILIVLFLNFLLFYPILTGVFLPRDWLLFFFRTNLTKNPFR